MGIKSRATEKQNKMYERHWETKKSVEDWQEDVRRIMLHQFPKLDEENLEYLYSDVLFNLCRAGFPKSVRNYPECGSKQIYNYIFTCIRNAYLTAVKKQEKHMYYSIECAKDIEENYHFEDQIGFFQSYKNLNEKQKEAVEMILSDSKNPWRYGQKHYTQIELERIADIFGLQNPNIGVSTNI